MTAGHQVRDGEAIPRTFGGPDGLPLALRASGAHVATQLRPQPRSVSGLVWTCAVTPPACEGTDSCATLEKIDRVITSDMANAAEWALRVMNFSFQCGVALRWVNYRRSCLAATDICDEA